MRTAWGALALLSFAQMASAQFADAPGPFGSLAIAAGPLGFARPPVTTGAIGLHGHVPAGPLLIGGYLAEAIVHSHGSRGARASIGMATVAYARVRAVAWQFYPYAGAGVATLRARHGDAVAGAAMTAGLGAEALQAPRGIGMVLAGRVGYVTRSLNDDESIAFAMIGVGIGGRVRPGQSPVIAHR